MIKSRAGAILESYDDLVTQMQGMMDQFAKENGGYINRPKNMTPLSEIMGASYAKGAAGFGGTNRGEDDEQKKRRKEAAGKGFLAGAALGAGTAATWSHVAGPAIRGVGRLGKAALKVMTGSEETK